MISRNTKYDLHFGFQNTHERYKLQTIALVLRFLNRNLDGRVASQHRTPFATAWGGSRMQRIGMSLARHPTRVPVQVLANGVSARCLEECLQIAPACRQCVHPSSQRYHAPRAKCLAQVASDRKQSMSTSCRRTYAERARNRVDVDMQTSCRHHVDACRHHVDIM